MHRGGQPLVSEAEVKKDEIRCTVEVREDATRQSPGRLVGTILTYGERASDRAEVFEDGALTWPEGGIVLNRQHQRGAPIMRITPEVRGGAVVVDQALPDTVAGRDAMREIRDGLFRGLSIEFRALKQSYVGGLRRIQEAVLGAVGLVDQGSYAGSTVEVRGGRTRRLPRWL